MNESIQNVAFKHDILSSVAKIDRKEAVKGFSRVFRTSAGIELERTDSRLRGSKRYSRSHRQSAGVAGEWQIQSLIDQVGYIFMLSLLKANRDETLLYPLLEVQSFQDDMGAGGMERVLDINFFEVKPLEEKSNPLFDPMGEYETESDTIPVGEPTEYPAEPVNIMEDNAVLKNSDFIEQPVDGEESIKWPHKGGADHVCEQQERKMIEQVGSMLLRALASLQQDRENIPIAVPVATMTEREMFSKEYRPHWILKTDLEVKLFGFRASHKSDLLNNRQRDKHKAVIKRSLED